jgi:hypothetical protein
MHPRPTGLPERDASDFTRTLPPLDFDQREWLSLLRVHPQHVSLDVVRDARRLMAHYDWRRCGVGTAGWGKDLFPLRRFTDEPVAEIVQCTEPAFAH